MAANRDVTVNLKGDASSLLKAAADAKAALEQLRISVNELDTVLQRIGVVLNNPNFGAALKTAVSGAATTITTFSTDATGQILRVDEVIRQNLVGAFDAAKTAENEMAAAIADGAERVRVTIDDLGRMTIKTTQSTGQLSAEEQKLRGFVQQVVDQLNKMQLAPRFQNELTAATERYNAQLMTTRAYLLEISRIQRRANADIEATGRRTEARTYAAAASLLMLGRRALRVGKDIMASFTDTAEAVYKMQMIMGGTAEELSKLKFAGDQVGVSAKEITTRMGLLESHLAKNDDYAKRLGVSYKNLDGSLKSPMQVLGEVGDRLNGISDAFARSTLAREVFGRGYQAIEPLLRQGSAGMAELAKQAKDLGLVLDQEGVEAGVRYQMTMRQMHQAAQGLGMALAQTLAPALTTIAQIVTGVVNWFRQMYTASNGLGSVLRVVVPILLGFVAALTAAAVAFRVGKVAASIFNKELFMSPVTWITLAIVALAGVMVYLVKHFDWGTKVVAFFGAALGALVGTVISSVIVAFQVMTAGVAYFLFSLGKVGGWLSHIPGLGFLKGPSKELSDWVVGFEKKLTKLAITAPKKGWDMGYKYGKAAGEGLRNAKLPSIPELFSGQDGVDFGSPAAGGGGGSKKNPLLALFERMVANARDALNAVREKAKDTKKSMDDMAKNVAESITRAFSLTELAGAGYASPRGLIGLFKRRLEDMRQFAANVKKLRAMGLPVDMMVDIVNAGVAGGSQIAKMLVANPQAITELAGLNAQVKTEAGDLGQFVAQAQYGPQLAAYISDAVARQAQFGRLLTAGKPLGYKPTEADIEAATTNITQQVMMNVDTNADPAAIEQAIAWALKTGATFGRGPRRPTTTRPGGQGHGAGTSWMPTRFNAMQMLHDLFPSSSFFQPSNPYEPSGTHYDPDRGVVADSGSEGIPERVA